MRPLLLSSLTALLLGRLPTFGQVLGAPPAGHPLLAWRDSVQQLATPQQVAAVQVRAWRDTLVALSSPGVCYMPVLARHGLPALQQPAPAGAKPAGSPLLYIVDGQPFSRNDATTIGALQRLLTQRRIQQVTLLFEASATAIYGTRGANGVVVLSSTPARSR